MQKQPIGRSNSSLLPIRREARLKAEAGVPTPASNRNSPDAIYAPPAVTLPQGTRRRGPGPAPRYRAGQAQMWISAVFPGYLKRAVVSLNKVNPNNVYTRIS